MVEHALIPHPCNPPDVVSVVAVSLTRQGDVLSLAYRIEGGPLDLPQPAAAVRTDELWRRTCFELFAQTGDGAGYIEFNFSPSGAWAAYAFDRYRSGMRPLPLKEEPVVTWVGGCAHVRCVLPSGIAAAPVALTAVIQEANGPTSFWSLAHPVDQPDFHHAANFVGRLPLAAEAA